VTVQAPPAPATTIGEEPSQARVKVPSPLSAVTQPALPKVIGSEPTQSMLK
jgi:hypothetical protein